MKARSASLTLYHFADGHHREVCVWHDQDHKPEVVATTPGIFISQRWVAPPDLMAARSPSTLPHNGGEYVNLYWSSGSAEELDADFDVLGRRLELVGRMEPMRYIERTFGRRLRPVSSRLDPVWRYRATRSPARRRTRASGWSSASSSLARAARTIARWHETEHIPRSSAPVSSAAPPS